LQLNEPLIVQGDLRNSIAVVKEGDGVFVGVLRSAKSSGGGSLVNVAAIHEFGSRPIVLKITPKVRALLHAAFRKAGLDAPSGERPSTGVAVIRIPPRPFLRPVFEVYGAPEVVAKRFVDRPSLPPAGAGQEDSIIVAYVCASIDQLLLATLRLLADRTGSLLDPNRGTERL